MHAASLLIMTYSPVVSSDYLKLDKSRSAIIDFAAVILTLYSIESIEQETYDPSSDSGDFPCKAAEDAVLLNPGERSSSQSIRTISSNLSAVDCRGSTLIIAAGILDHPERLRQRTFSPESQHRRTYGALRPPATKRRTKMDFILAKSVT